MSIKCKHSGPFQRHLHIFATILDKAKKSALKHPDFKKINDVLYDSLINHCSTMTEKTPRNIFWMKPINFAEAYVSLKADLRSINDLDSLSTLIKILRLPFFINLRKSAASIQ